MIVTWWCVVVKRWCVGDFAECEFAEGEFSEGELTEEKKIKTKRKLFK